MTGNFRPCRSVLLVLVIIMTFVSPGMGQENLRRLVSTTFDYDAVIEQTSTVVSQTSVSPDKRETLLLAGYAYYLKGRLLLSSYTAAGDVAALYFDCRASRTSRDAKGQLLPFARGMLEAATGRIEEGIADLLSFQKSTGDKKLSMRCAIWIGALQDKLGRGADRDKSWQGIDWGTAANSLERSAALAVLGIARNGEAQSHASLQGLRDPVSARNIVLSASDLSRYSRAEKIQLLNMLDWKQPAYTNTGKALEEKYFDLLSLLAGGRCALAIGREIIVDAMKQLSAEERKKYATLPFALGWSSFLLGDWDGLSAALADDKDPRSPVLLGAAAYQKGDTKRADSYWVGVEQGKDVRAKSWLGYIYALLGIRFDKASDLARQFLNSGEDGVRAAQDFSSRYAAVYERKAASESDKVKQRQAWSMARDIFNDGCIWSKVGVFESGGNDPEYAVLCAAALERVDGTRMWDVNKLLFFGRQKYDCLIPVYEMATGLTSCREVKTGK